MTRIERVTSPLPRECSTTEPHGQSTLVCLPENRTGKPLATWHPPLVTTSPLRPRHQRKCPESLEGDSSALHFVPGPCGFAARPRPLNHRSLDRTSELSPAPPYQLPEVPLGALW